MVAAMRPAHLLLVCGVCGCQGAGIDGEVESAGTGPTTTTTMTGTGTGVGSTVSPTTAAGTEVGTATGTGTATGVGTMTEGSTGTEESTGSATTEAEGTTGPMPEEKTLRFAMIGDYGLDGDPTAKVAALVTGWDPEIVITAGDNNYPNGLATTIDAHIGKHYHGFIAPYVGEFGAGAEENRFFPSPGNHDWNSGTLQPYLDYFTLPGNERYYAVERGPVEFFMLNSDSHEPDGVKSTQTQGQWLEMALAESTAAFQVVVLHHAPYSSGDHGGAKGMRWPFKEWGADLVLAGHDHDYERFVVDGLSYLVVGTSGAALRKFGMEEEGSQRGFATSFGALRVEASETRMTLDFIGVDGGLVDRMVMAAKPPTGWTPKVATGSTWWWHESDPGADWTALDFINEASWESGPAPLGFDIGGEGTLLPGGGDPKKRPMTTYFRHHFAAEAGDLGPWLRLRMAVDDGAVVHLNGVEVYRINVPEGPIADSTPASLAVGGWFPQRMAETLIAGDALVVGENILAVEVHQQAPTSSDLRLELELSAAN